MKNGKYRQRQKEAKVEKRPESREAAAPSGPVPAGGYDEKMVEHVRMATSLLEGRKVSRQEVLEMLAEEEKRQHSIGHGERSDYGVRDLNENSS